MDASYPSESTNKGWGIPQPKIPKRKTKRGRTREVPFRQILNGILDLNKEECQWRALPQEFGPWQTVYHYFRLWNPNGLWQEINDALVGKLRTRTLAKCDLLKSYLGLHITIEVRGLVFFG